MSSRALSSVKPCTDEVKQEGCVWKSAETTLKHVCSNKKTKIWRKLRSSPSSPNGERTVKSFATFGASAVFFQCASCEIRTCLVDFGGRILQEEEAEQVSNSLIDEMPFQFDITAKLHSWRSLLLRPFWALLGHSSSSSSNMSPLGQEGTTSMDSTTYSIPSSQRICKYDVFISFRGTDTRNTFVDHLYHHLIRKGIFVFKDDKKLHKGKLISPQLIEAIQHSRVSIIVFSDDYASSTWCLDEMATIAECHLQFNQTVFPVFYDVDPSHVRNLNGVYLSAFALHTENYKHDPAKLDRWKTAMRSFGRSVGWDVRNKPEFGHDDWNGKGTNKVKAIVLDQKKDTSGRTQLRAEGLSTMRSLVILILYHKNFSGCLNFLSNSLQYLLWQSYPFASLPLDFEPYRLVELNLPNSNIQQLWEGHKDLPCLKRVDLSNSKYLIETPNFQGSRRLERLDLTGCTNLSQVHPSIGLLEKLTFLSLEGCSNLVSLNFGAEFNLYSLRVLHLSGCSKLESTPNFTGVSNLEYLDIDQLSAELMSSYCLEYLIFLDLGFCNLWRVPNAIGENPCHFRCGFDIVVPGTTIPKWFGHQYRGDLKVRIANVMNGRWVGVAFCAAFGEQHYPIIFGSSYPFCLSFESEHMEESFQMPLHSELNKVDSSKAEHLWLIFISRPHCHFATTGATITFKAHPALEIKKWGFRMVFKEDAFNPYNIEAIQVDDLLFDYAHESSSHSWPKIQLPYNWLLTEGVHESSSCSDSRFQLPYNWFVTEEEEIENREVNVKEEFCMAIKTLMVLTRETQVLQDVRESLQAAMGERLWGFSKNIGKTSAYVAELWGIFLRQANSPPLKNAIVPYAPKSHTLTLLPSSTGLSIGADKLLTVISGSRIVQPLHTSKPFCRGHLLQRTLLFAEYARDGFIIVDFNCFIRIRKLVNKSISSSPEATFYPFTNFDASAVFFQFASCEIRTCVVHFEGEFCKRKMLSKALQLAGCVVSNSLIDERCLLNLISPLSYTLGYYSSCDRFGPYWVIVHPLIRAHWAREVQLPRIPFPGLVAFLRLHASVNTIPESTMIEYIVGEDLPHLKMVDLNNSINLTETPNFEGSPRLERLDFTGCTNLVRVHPSIGLLSKLAFLSLRNCSNLVTIDFGNVCNLGNLGVLHLSGCTKLESTPVFSGVVNLEYLDFDGCTGLSSVHPSIGTLTKLKFLSLIDCTKLAYLPLIPATFSSSHLKFLISMDLSFCNLLEVPAAIGQLECLERLNLQGNKFASLPSTIMDLSCLAYLNLAHCHVLKYLPDLPIKSASSVGRYFKTASGSRDHRSGLYVFDCPRVDLRYWREELPFQLRWFQRLLKNPHHFRSGFDIVLPYHQSSTYFEGNPSIQRWFHHIFSGDSIKRVVNCNSDGDWIGFVFFVAFEVKNLPTNFGSPHHSSSSQLPHPFYLSFQSEWVEERFDMPLNLELDKIDRSQHIWTIYISRQHCHFIETGAHITFKARPGLVVKKWGLSRIVKQEIHMLIRENHDPSRKGNLVIGNVEKSSTNSGHKIQLPYNWLVTKEDEDENLEAKAKENNLCNLGL
ncbi:hypothetical protein VNO77_28409 [Canavalia gladiata]|uniref:TIR domain-containing protein n=1 Tax=Canavalia gladiata TaxID=3824 RepID=A0AAN9KYA9_CANGL